MVYLRRNRHTAACPDAHGHGPLTGYRTPARGQLTGNPRPSSPVSDARRMWGMVGLPSETSRIGSAPCSRRSLTGPLAWRSRQPEGREAAGRLQSEVLAGAGRPAPVRGRKGARVVLERSEMGGASRM